MSRRSRAREIVLQVLYQDDLNSPPVDQVLQQFLRGRLSGDEKLIRFANDLIDGVRQHRAQIDELIETTAENWKLSRMAATDRNVLRLGTFEILYSDTPGRVAMNEAIELAKRYGAANSSQFVNGILDRLMKKNQPLQEPEAKETEATVDQNDNS